MFRSEKKTSEEPKLEKKNCHEETITKNREQIQNKQI